MTSEVIRFVLEARGQVRLRARGRSMRPLIPDGSEVLVVAPPGRIRIGDLVLAEQGSTLVLHRVVGRTPGGGWRTKGDGRHAPDPPVSGTALLGRAVEVSAWGRRWRLDTPMAHLVGWLAAHLL